MNFEQFEIDCERIDIFYGNEKLTYSTSYVLLDKFIQIYTDENIAINNVIKYCTQIPLAKHYINKVSEIVNNQEHLLSAEIHSVHIDKETRMLKIQKGFTRNFIIDGNDFFMDFYNLKIHYNPFTDVEEHVEWNGMVNNMLMSKSVILDDDSWKYW